tara:strand:- start:3446 stop:3775 length:330 start_codon:yes stop_codon:yes gene_type:complete
MNLNIKLLGQLRPAATTAEIIFSPRTGSQVVLTSIYICNLSSSKKEYSLYFDNDGTTYDETTALAFETEIQGNTTAIVEIEIPLRNSAGGFAVQTSSANDINFTLFGEE